MKKVCSLCGIEKEENDFYAKMGVNKCKSCIQKQCREYYHKHKKEISIRSGRWRKRNRGQQKQYKIEYYKRNKQIINSKCKKYYKTNKDKCCDVSAKYRLNHMEEKRACERNRRALKIGVGYEPYLSSYVFERDGWVCGICGRKINKQLKHPDPLSPSIDHIVPLSKGGTDSPINVQESHLRCNFGKQATNRGQLRLFG
jgi:hypothetical protein